MSEEEEIKQKEVTLDLDNQRHKCKITDPPITTCKNWVLLNTYVSIL